MLNVNNKPKSPKPDVKPVGQKYCVGNGHNSACSICPQPKSCPLLSFVNAK